MTIISLSIPISSYIFRDRTEPEKQAMAEKWQRLINPFTNTAGDVFLARPTLEYSFHGSSTMNSATEYPDLPA